MAGNRRNLQRFHSITTRLQQCPLPNWNRNIAARKPEAAATSVNKPGAAFSSNPGFLLRWNYGARLHLFSTFWRSATAVTLNERHFCDVTNRGPGKKRKSTRQRRRPLLPRHPVHLPQLETGHEGLSLLRAVVWRRCPQPHDDLRP